MTQVIHPAADGTISGRAYLAPSFESNAAAWRAYEAAALLAVVACAVARPTMMRGFDGTIHTFDRYGCDACAYALDLIRTGAATKAVYGKCPDCRKAKRAGTIRLLTQAAHQRTETQ